MPKAPRRRAAAVELYERFPNAHALWSAAVEGRHPFTLTAYAVNGHVILLQQFDDENGWDAYLPASKSNRITDVLNALEQFTK